VNISKTKKDIPFFALKSLSNQQQLFFYFIGTLNNVSAFCHIQFQWQKLQNIFEIGLKKI